MFDWGAAEWINCVYFAAVAIGLIWTVLSLIGADFDTDVDLDVGGPDLDFHLGNFDLGGVHVPDMDVALDSPDIPAGGGVNLPSISSFTISSFLAGFGGAGIIANLAFQISIWWSVVVATAGGLLLGGAMQLIFGAILLKAQGSSEVRVSKLRGAVAEVTVPITAGGLGQIAFVSGGRRVTYSARAESGEEVARGARVSVLQVVGGTALVRQVEEKV